jgi:uncharacterized membrane protein
MGYVPALDATPRPRSSRLLVGALWCGVVLLVLIGVTAALGRSVFLSDLATRAEPFRQQVLDALRRDDPFALQRAEQLALFDRRFAAYPATTLLHIVPGAIFLILAPLQFVSRIRDRHIRFHRWSGRLIVLAAWVSGVAGLFFGLLMPYGGRGEAIAIALFGGLLLTAVSVGLVSIRRGQLARHREWMIRAFAAAIAVSTVRVVAAVLDLALTPAGFGPQAIFVLSIWIGWVVTVGAAELWIIYTRPPAPIAPSTLSTDRPVPRATPVPSMRSPTRRAAARSRRGT